MSNPIQLGSNSAHFQLSSFPIFVFDFLAFCYALRKSEKLAWHDSESRKFKFRTMKTNVFCKSAKVKNWRRMLVKFENEMNNLGICMNLQQTSRIIITIE